MPRHAPLLVLLGTLPALAMPLDLQNNTERPLRWSDAAGEHTLAPGEATRFADVPGQLTLDGVELTLHHDHGALSLNGMEQPLPPLGPDRSEARLQFELVAGDPARLTLSELDQPVATGPDELSLISWNVQLRPRFPFKDQQLLRVQRLPQRLQGYDVVVLCEVFDGKSQRQLLDALREEYPYVSQQVGKRLLFRQHAGVFILSRWPLEDGASATFDVSSGGDRFAKKGVTYAAVRKHGRRFHLLAAHTQAGQDKASKARQRARQFGTLADFLAQLALPANEPVLLAGDLNIRLRPDEQGAATGEAAEVLERLGFSSPPRVGQPHTLTPLNAYIHANKPPQVLDYVLVADAHLQPLSAVVRTMLLRAPEPFLRRGQPCWDLSDHYPVAARFRFPPAAKSGLSQALDGD